jgi:hypothetical protein
MKSRCKGGLLSAVVAIALTALAAPSAGATTTPAAGYEQFAGCPDPSVTPLNETCVRRVTTGGHLQMGSLEIPVTNPFTLSGGLTASGAFSFNSKGGLTKVKQPVPGGVIGLTGLTWLAEFLGAEALAAYAVIELVPPAGNPLGEPASMPVKVHLTNSVLGNKCYVGSDLKPIELELITGTTSPPAPNVPITGNPGSSTPTLSGVTDISGGTYLDNAFEAPGANGCVLTLFGFPPMSINGLINSESGLPAEAGNNEVIQEFKAESVSSALVYP